MHSNDEQLRLAYGASLASGATRRSHVTPDALLALAERSGSEASRLEVLDHVMACDACRRELDLVRASIAAAGVPRQRTWFRSPSIGLMAIAATLLIAAGVRMFVTPRSPDAGSLMRGGSGVSTYEVRWLPFVGAGLAWRPTAGAVSYRLEVVDEAGAAVVDSTMRDTTFLVPAAALRNRRGLSWSVTTVLSDGSTVTSLPVPITPPAR
jgi:hypothetical protein